MPFEPEELPPATPPFFDDDAGGVWVPLYRHACTFGPDLFVAQMINMVRNPNLNSSWLFRADILYDDGEGDAPPAAASPPSRPRDVVGMPRLRTLVRKLIPRNEPSASTLVLYMPHAESAADLPFYHPKVRGIAHLHQWHNAQGAGSISLHFLPFHPHYIQDQRARRTAYHLLEILHKHGQSSASGYTKRVHHDVIIPQAAFQDRYAHLKSKYARQLVDTWAESTDPEKHVFEDLGIAAFLLELWARMYKGSRFPGFVDIGCGNGLLVYILLREGYHGWGFDARARKSWAQYQMDAPCAPWGRSLQQRLLFPSVVTNDPPHLETGKIGPQDMHDGTFPTGTFIISNHGDELTPWTPILAAMSQCPFIVIPCCSHNLAGDKYRAPAPRDKSKPKSTYASLVDWVAHIAQDCGWEVEVEMLRIPSTRNTCLLGRSRTQPAVQVDVETILGKYGGVQRYTANVTKLVKSGPRAH